MRFLKKYSLFLAAIGMLVCFIWFEWWHLSKSIFPLALNEQKGDLTFSLAAPLPVRLTEAGGTAFNNKFYILGGIDGFGKTNNKFWEYEPKENSWKALPDLPAYINHPGVVAVNNKIYVAGGFDPIGIRLRWLMFADWKPLKSLYIYDIASSSWSRGPNMPFHRGAGGVAACDTAIWYTGGINEKKEISNDFAYLSLKDNQWHMLPSMTVARDHMRMELVGNKLYAISGRKDDLRKNLGTVEVFDLTTKQWTSVDNIPTPRGGFSSIVTGKYIYTFGGEFFFNCFDEIERLNTETGHWEKLPALPEARHGIVSGLINGKIHLVSGGRHPRISTSDIHRVMEVKE
jgi:N-acetylneuraminic acid mutarotase